ncbi:MAG: oxidoreductase [Dehalococcoidia bacterium]|nr:oxidoreductase [Dehalococcoidia bacterium]
MKILVTGGSGFVGSHTVSALLDAGHQVKLFARSIDRIESALMPLGIDVSKIEYEIGDITDIDSVERAVQGVDAIVHAAAVYTMDKRRAREIRTVNVKGTQTILDAAFRAGLDPIIYVSSVSALMPPDGEKLNPESAVKNPKGTYVGSKAQAEKVARNYQSQGAPITITYPGCVIGPKDPHFGEGTDIIIDIIKGRYNPLIKAHFPLIDVRDLAKLHVKLMEPGKGARRYFISGERIPFTDLIDKISELTGRKIRYFMVPSWLIEIPVRLIDLLSPFLPFRVPVTLEGFRFAKWDPIFDDSKTHAELKISLRPYSETLSDTIKWLHSIGKINDEQVGKLAKD